MNLRHASLRLIHNTTDVNLRAKLARLIMASLHQRVAGGDRAEYLDQVWNMYETSYKTIGMHLSNKHDLLKYHVWDLQFNTEHKPVASTLFEETSHGLKVCLLGTDGSPMGKSMLAQGMKTTYNTNGVYGEVSGRIKDILISSGTPVVCTIFVEKILGKKVTPDPKDPVSYSRPLTGVGIVHKTMCGKPKGIPYTEADYPICPARVYEIEGGRFAAGPDDSWFNLGMHTACQIWENV